MNKNIVIIGAGPAGEAAAKTLRRLGGANVNITLIEKEKAGGLCLNKGCIPSKTLLEQVHKRTELGLPIEWVYLQQAKTNVVTKIRTALEGSLKSQKIQVEYGTAEFDSPSSIKVTSSTGSKIMSFDTAIIAAGTEPLFPPPLDQYRSELLDSEKMLEIASTPKSMAVIGGGAIGCEFACLLNAAGCQVTIIELKDGLLPGEDEAVVAALQRSYEARGIQIKTGVKVKAITKNGENWSLTYSDDQTQEFEKVLVSVGRTPSLTGLGLDKAGVKTDRTILVNDFLQTSNPNIYAVGDIAGTRLAHAAAAQAEVAATNVLGGKEIFDDSFVPRCLYSWPEVASVGMWKYQLEAAGKPVKTARAFFQGSAKAMAANETEGFVQIVSDGSTGDILGAQIIGPHATELIHIFSLALKNEMTVKELSEVMFAHPTLSEVIKDAARK